MRLFGKLFSGRRIKSFGVPFSIPRYGVGAGLAETELVKSPTLSACMRWIQAGILEPALSYEEWTGDDERWQPKPWPVALEWLRSDIVAGGFIQQTAASRLQGLAYDIAIYGNGLLYVLRAEGGAPIGLMRMPWGSIVPQITGGIINGFRGSSGLLMRPEDVIHIRRGSSASEPALGYSLVPALREPVSADTEAARYMRAMLDVPSPSYSITGEGIGQENTQQVADAFKAALSGNNAGKVAVIPADMSVSAMGFSPEQMAIKELAEHPQHAICSLLGVPPQALDVSAARGASTYNNVREATRKGALSCLMPLWAMIEQALSEEAQKFTNGRVVFDTQNVLALQEDEDLKAQRAAKLYQAGVIDRFAAKVISGEDPNGEDRGWYSSFDRMPAPLSSTEMQSIREQVGA
jgi:HK97 family phage portal protein